MEQTRQVVAKIEWHPGELFAKTGSSSPPFCTQRAVSLLQSARHRRAAHQRRQERHHLPACPASGSVTMRSGFSFMHWLIKTGVFLQGVDLPEEIARLVTYQHPNSRLIKIGAKKTGADATLAKSRSTGRGRREWRVVWANHRCHPRHQATAEACMTAQLKKTAQTRLHRCVLAPPKGPKRLKKLRHHVE